MRDSDLRVRKNTLMVLTHLILNDMIKVKGQIAEMAICLEDADMRISDLAKYVLQIETRRGMLNHYHRLFFLELSKKGNAIYNVLPDVISALSESETPIEPEKFKNIGAYLFSFIDKVLN